MPDQKLTFGVNLDLAGFDQGVNKVKNQLKELERAKDTLGRSANTLQGEGQMGHHASQAYGSFMKESKQGLNNQFASQKREMSHNMVNLRALQSEQRELEKIQKIEKNLTNEKRERLSLVKQETQALIERQKQLTNDAAAVKQTMGRFADDSSGGSGKGGGASIKETAKDPKRGIKELLQSISVAAIIRGAINSAEFIVNKEQGSLRATGQAAAVASNEMAEERQGQGFKGVFYAEQRKKAMQMAMKKKEGQSSLDLAKIGGMVGGGMLAGSMVPGVGTVAGGVMGLVGAMGNEQLMARMTSPDHYNKLMTKQGMQDYRANLDAERAKDPGRTFAEKKFSRDTNKYLDLQLTGGFDDEGLLGKQRIDQTALEQANTISNIPMARKRTMREAMEVSQAGKDVGNNPNVYPFSGQGPLAPEFGGLQADSFLSGIGDIEKRKANQQISLERQSQGYIKDQMKGVFDNNSNQLIPQEDILRMRKQIISQGGTADQDLARSAAKAERNLGLKSAGSIFGKLAGSGGGFDSKKSEDAVKRILTEAVKSGVDLSKMPVQLDRFATVAVELATKGGGFSQSAVQTLADASKGYTAKDMQVGASAFEDANKRAKGGDAFGKQIGFGFMLGDEGKEILGPKAQKMLEGNSNLLNRLNQTSEKDLDQLAGGALGISEELGGEKTGMTPEKVMELIRGKAGRQQFRLPGMRKKIKEFTDATEGMTNKEELAYVKTPEGAKLHSETLSVTGGSVTGFLQQGVDKQVADRDVIASMNSKRVTDKASADKVSVAYNKEKKTAFTAKKDSEAIGELTDIQGLTDNLGKLRLAAEHHTVSAELYNRQFTLFMKALEKNGKAMETINSQLGGVISDLMMRGIMPASVPENN